MNDSAKSSIGTPCEEFARAFREMRRGNGVTVEEWQDLWETLHRKAREAGKPCPCDDSR